MLLAIALLLQVVKGGIPPVPGLAPINDLHAQVEGSVIHLTCTAPFDSTGAGVQVDDVQFRVSTTGPLLEADWFGYPLIYSTAAAGLTLRSGAAVACTLADLADGDYWIDVRAKGGLGWNSPANPALGAVTIGSGATVPLVTGLAIVPGSATTSSVQLSWNALTGSATQLMIYQGPTESPAPSTEALADWISGTTVVVTGLSPSTTYYFAAKSRNATGTLSALSSGPHPSATTLAAGGGSAGAGESGGGSSPGCPQSAAGAAAPWMACLGVLMAGMLIRRS